jgi:hypothetical protein
MALHVVFTGDGLPGWIGAEPRDGSEPVDKDLAFLTLHRRTAKGAWVRRAAPVPAEPSPDDRAAAAEAERAALQEARDAALRDALAAEADPLFFKWQREECLKEEWLAAVAAVKARFPKP